jgi:hypothetical protein
LLLKILIQVLIADRLNVPSFYTHYKNFVLTKFDFKLKAFDWFRVLSGAPCHNMMSLGGDSHIFFSLDYTFFKFFNMLHVGVIVEYIISIVMSFINSLFQIILSDLKAHLKYDLNCPNDKRPI